MMINHQSPQMIDDWLKWFFSLCLFKKMMHTILFCFSIVSVYHINTMFNQKSFVFTYRLWANSALGVNKIRKKPKRKDKHRSEVRWSNLNVNKYQCHYLHYWPCIYLVWGSLPKVLHTPNKQWGCRTDRWVRVSADCTVGTSSYRLLEALWFSEMSEASDGVSPSRPSSAVDKCQCPTLPPPPTHTHPPPNVISF